MNNNSIPYSEEAERSVLGAVLLDNNAIEEALEVLKPEYFYFERNELIFRYMSQLFQENKPIDLVTLMEKIKINQSRVDLSYLGELSEAVPVSTSIGYYADIVYQRYRLRRFIILSTNAIADARNLPEDIDSFFNQHEDAMFSIANSAKLDDVCDVSQDTDEYIRSVQDLQDGKVTPGILSGIPQLDEFLGGFEPQTMTIVGARPSVGKTALGLQMAVNMSQKEPVLFCSMEMSKMQIKHRLYCSIARINSRRLKHRGSLNDDQWLRLIKAKEQVQTLKLHVCDRAGLSPMEIYAMAKAIKRKRGSLGAVVVDYLQLCKADQNKKGMSRENEVSQISRAMKNLSKNLDCPTIVLAQLNRDAAKRGGAWPRVHDLRESGEIEASADNIILLHNQAAEDRQADKDNMKSATNSDVTDQVSLILGKVRSGATGIVELNFIPRYGVFE